MFVLGSHYRNPLTFSDEAIEAAEKGLERLIQAANSESAQVKANVEKLDARSVRQKFTEVMDDDFNTPQALAVLFDIARDINRGIEQGADVSELRHALKELAGVLGLTLKKIETAFTDAAPFIELLIKTRKQLRDAKQFKLADEIRDKLLETGVIMEDTAQGTTWKRKK
jgi:cysteinyl-tRNA synthetase